jgi:hypothetical protein
MRRFVFLFNRSCVRFGIAFLPRFRVHHTGDVGGDTILGARVNALHIEEFTPFSHLYGVFQNTV